jgi:hypothetical protein
MIKSMRRTSIKQMLVLSRFNFPSELFEKGILMLGGSANLQHSGHYYYGDLSGINTSKIPLWFTPFFKPGDRISRIRDWDQKIEEIALQAKNWDIWVVTGIPSWMQLLFERIIQHHGVRTIHDIWPNLQVFAYGGVAMDPYLPAFERICARPLSYIETYLASEGFLAYDTRIAPERKGMRLSLNNGIYYEFIPFDEDHFDEDGQVRPQAQAIPLDRVEAHKDYALLITTCSGAWRYLIGDTVRFTSLSPYRIRVSGRTKHHINVFGEELMVENTDMALAKTCSDIHCEVKDYTVAPIFMKDKEKGAHEWMIEFKKQPDDIRLFQKTLDENLQSLNSDYEAKRYNNMTLNPLVVNVARENLFYDWLKENNKLGGQHKIPRLSNERDYLEQLKSMQNEVKSI